MFGEGGELHERPDLAAGVDGFGEVEVVVAGVNDLLVVLPVLGIEGA